MDIHAVLGIAAGLCAFAAYPVYIRAILRGETKPSRVTWWVLTLSNGMIAASYFASGARDTIWIPVVYALGFGITAILSLKYGEEGWTTTDKISIAGVVLSAAVWILFNSPELALFAVVSVEFFGLLPTMSKSYSRPWTENKLAWQIATLGSLINIFAIEMWTLSVALYPFYVLITNGIIAYFLTFPRAKES